jgi:hypothetical protein
MKQCIFIFSICIWSAFHMALFTNGVNYIYLTSWSRVLVEKVIVLQLVMRSGAAHWHHLPKIHLNIMCVCVCVLTCSKWLEWLMWIILFVHYISPMTCTWSQLVYFIITYYFLLLVLAHLSYHQGEPSTRENIIHVYIKI